MLSHDRSDVGVKMKYRFHVFRPRRTLFTHDGFRHGAKYIIECELYLTKNGVSILDSIGDIIKSTIMQ